MLPYGIFQKSNGVTAKARPNRLERCQIDIEEYFLNITSEHVRDISFSQDFEQNRLRTNSAITKIEEIKSLPLLTDEPIHNKIAFYQKMRAKDVDVALIEGQAIHQLRAITGLDPINVGSFGLLLNIASSDLDLGLGIPFGNDFFSVCRKLIDAGFKYKQARDTRFLSAQQTTQRFVFSHQRDGFDIDVSVYHSADLFLLADGGFKCRNTMTEIEKAEHTWNKFTLKERGLDDEYILYKLEPYIIYKPGFKWVAIN